MRYKRKKGNTFIHNYLSNSVLDVSRFVCVLADYVGVSPVEIHAEIVGEHGDSQVILWNSTTVRGIPISQYCAKNMIPFGYLEKSKMERAIIDIGTNIIKGKGRTHYGIATCVCNLADAILNNHPMLACVSTVFEGEYGFGDVAMSFPCIVDANGVMKSMGRSLEEEEHEKLEISAKTIKKFLVYKEPCV